MACLRISLFALFVRLLAFVLAGSDFQPEAWPDRWVGFVIRNGTSAEGLPLGIDTLTKYYDYSNPTEPLYKQECLKKGISATFLLIGSEGYLYNEAYQLCQNISLPIFVVYPEWMKGGEYSGVEVINNIPSNLWIKLNHKYYESVNHPKRPTRVYTPADQNGAAHQEDYGVFRPVKLHEPDTFAVPTFCFNEEDMHLSISRYLEILQKEIDPMHCFT